MNAYRQLMSTPKRKQMFILIIFLIVIMFTTMLVFSAVVPQPGSRSEKKFTTQTVGSTTEPSKPLSKGNENKQIEQPYTPQDGNIQHDDEPKVEADKHDHNDHDLDHKNTLPPPTPVPPTVPETLQPPKQPEVKPQEPTTNPNTKPALKQPEDYSLTIGVIPEHQDSFHFLKKAIRQLKIPRSGAGIELLHIDSHSGGLIPQEINYKLPNIKNRNVLNQIKNVFQHLTHDDFIAPSVWMGIFSNKINWLRSSWPFQKYELPLGLHKILLGGRKTIPEDASFLCYQVENAEEKTFSKFFEANVKCKKKTKTKEMIWNVMDLDDGISKLDKTKEMVVTIDLDFFATKDQVIDQIFHQRKIIQKYFDLLESYFTKDKICLKDTLKDTVLINQLLHELFLTKRMVDDEYFSSKNETLKLWCKGEETAKQQLGEISKIFDYLFKIGKPESNAVLNFESRFPSINCKTDGYFGICESSNEPYRDTSKEEIKETLSKLIGVLKLLKKEPQLILVTRSLNGFTPLHSFPFIEKNLLSELKKLYPKSKLKYYKTEPITKSDEQKYVVKYKPSSAELTKLSKTIQNTNWSTLKKIKEKKLRKMNLFLTYSKKKQYYLNQILFNPEIFSKYQKWLQSKLQ